MDIPVVSLQTGRAVATARQPVFNPNNLKIEGWFCAVPGQKQTLFLSSSDIREFGNYGIAINSNDVIAPLEDFVRLEKLFRLNFQLIGKKIETESGKKVGKVEDFAVNIDSLFVQKLYVNQRALGAFIKDQLTVSRTQIREISDKKIVIAELEGFEKSFFKNPLQVPEG